MPVNKHDVIRIVKAGASDEAHKNVLLALACDKPGLWDGLDEEDVLGVLKQQAVIQSGNDVIEHSPKMTLSAVTHIAEVQDASLPIMLASRVPFMPRVLLLSQKP